MKDIPLCFVVSEKCPETDTGTRTRPVSGLLKV
jgi:hypothetical protein